MYGGFLDSNFVMSVISFDHSKIILKYNDKLIVITYLMIQGKQKHLVHPSGIETEFIHINQIVACEQWCAWPE